MKKVELTCRLRSVSDMLSDKKEYYMDLFTKWKESVEKMVDEAASWKMKSEMEKSEKKWFEELKVKQVNKFIQTV